MAKKYVHLSPKTNQMEECVGPDRCKYRNQNVPHAEAGDTARIADIMAKAHSNGTCSAPQAQTTRTKTLKH